MDAREVREELVTREPAEALAGLLDIDLPTGGLPPLWHWVYLLDRPPQAELGADGHPMAGVPAPPGSGVKRMFAGGRVETRGLLEYDVPATRTTYVSASQEKTGRSGPLTFVTVRSEYAQRQQLRIVDEADIVYRSPGSTVSARAGSLDVEPPAASREPALRLRADEALLFRFSALTFNAHRIHYDLRWVRREGYDDLVVHGPLQALMMGELLRRTGAAVVGSCFAYRLVSPMIGPQTFTTQPAESGDGVEVRDVFGTITARGSLTLLP